MKKIIFGIIVSIVSNVFTTSTNAYSEVGDSHVFTITGYYSPLPNQSFYVTGSYEGDIRLNGSGIISADGTPVYPGMIAAPAVFKFGTKICIPNLGCGMVHDRGGAIVQKGKRDLARFDRLDIWMGYGEEGLLRALAWGVQHLDCKIYSEDSPIQVAMNFEVPPMLNEILDLPKKPIFNQRLARGTKGKSVEILQESLWKLGFYEGLIDGIFDYKLEESVFKFQKKYFIVDKKDSFGAGVFGPQTSSKLASILYNLQIQEKIEEAWEKFHFEESLSKGAKNQAVLKLQEILVQEEFMEVFPTGYFGTKTESALTKFQIAHGIIKNEKSHGAGRVGPLTQEVLNKILEKKKELNFVEKKEVLAYQKQQDRLNYLAQKTQNLNFYFVKK